MKECEKLEALSMESRKARLEKHNRMIQRKAKTPEPSLLGSSLFSYDLSLNSLSLKTESECLGDFTCTNFSSRSKKPSELFYECINSNFSEKDQKILRLMASRREAKMKEDEFALNARKIWEQERENQIKKAEEKKRCLKKFLAKKKKIEEWEKFIRKNDRDENFKKEKMMLELRIHEKHEQVEKRQKNTQLHKKSKPEILNTKCEILFHKELKRQMEEEKEAEKLIHLQDFEEKKRKSEEKLRLLQKQRNTRLKEESLRRDLKWLAAKNMREELNRQYEEEQIRNLKFSEGSQAIKEERRQWATQWKTKIIFEKNQRERHQHALIYNKLKEEEMEKINQTKKAIQAKDLRMKFLKEKRESAILRSKNNARISSYLRQKMKTTYQL